jgi:hypothetical protein
MRYLWPIGALIAACSIPDEHFTAATGPAVRLVAPLSATAVTQRRPLLRWALGPGVTGPRVQLCRERDCASPLTIQVQVAADLVSGTPVSDLPPGWIYWRVNATLNAQQVTGPIWQLWVGKASATGPNSSAGTAVLDVNGDGYADLAIGTASASSHPVHVYLGSAATSADAWNAPSSTVRIDLPLAGVIALAAAGDVNGDGFGDLLIGQNPVALYLGSAMPTAASWTSDTTRRIALTAAGHMVGIGDVDGDGYADYLGEGIVHFGSVQPTGAFSPRDIRLTDPFDHLPVFAASAAGLGDVNGDGYADFAVATTSSSGASTYLYLGSAAPSEADWNSGVTHRFRIAGVAFPDQGFAVAGVGDINGDGYADFLVGGCNNSACDGAASLYLGTATPVTADWASQTATGRIDLVAPDGNAGRFGVSVASAGDLNGDGYGDFAIAAPNSAQGGTVHLYLGAAAPAASGWNGAAPAARIDLENPDGARASFGQALAAAGDVNGDGLGDLVIGAAGAGSGAGAAHLYLGLASPDAAAWSAVGSSSRLDLANLDGASAGFGQVVTAAAGPAAR